MIKFAAFISNETTGQMGGFAVIPNDVAAFIRIVRSIGYIVDKEAEHDSVINFAECDPYDMMNEIARSTHDSNSVAWTCVYLSEGYKLVATLPGSKSALAASIAVLTRECKACGEVHDERRGHDESSESSPYITDGHHH